MSAERERENVLTKKFDKQKSGNLFHQLIFRGAMNIYFMAGSYKCHQRNKEYLSLKTITHCVDFGWFFNIVNALSEFTQLTRFHLYLKLDFP